MPVPQDTGHHAVIAAHKDCPRQRSSSEAVFAFDVGCSTLGVRGFLLLSGRVAESGLRHSTRNRAWGNPPWVRIPPLPPVFAVSREMSRERENVTKIVLI